MKRVIQHIGFWLGIVSIYAYQNLDGTLDDYLTLLWILFISAIVVYINLFYLLPKYFFRKRYLSYGLLLLLLLVIGSPVLGLGMISDKKTLASYPVQNFINLLFFVIITSSFKFYREYQNKQSRLIEVENEQLKIELKLLETQINPHFMFNTLNNLYGLIIQNKNEQAATVTLKLSDLMRYLLQSSKVENVRLSEEIQFLEDYLSLEKIRLAQNADIQLQKTGVEKEVLIAPLLFIPLVENAFKHGLQSLTNNCYARFTLAKQENEIFFEAKNSVGKHLNKTPSGTGLKNLRKRLELIYPENHILEIEQNKAYFKVSLQISL